MKKRAKTTAKKPVKASLPDPLSGLAIDDLLWDCTSPLATLIFEDLEREPPAPAFWSTVSGLAAYYASNCQAQTAKATYEGTTAPVLRRLREIRWLYRQQIATQHAMLLWSALLSKLKRTYPDANDGQLWVLVRDALRALRDEHDVVNRDGR